VPEDFSRTKVGSTLFDRSDDLTGDPHARSPKKVRMTMRSLILFRVAAALGILAARPCQGDVAAELKALFARLPAPEVSAGVMVLDLSTGETVFALNADRPMVPASNMKVFTMAAAIAVLGPQFAFETRLATDGVHLYVIGDGDPGFGDEKLHAARGEKLSIDFERWAGALKSRGISSIPGDLVIDESVFDGQLVHPTWESGDLDNWYAAPVNGLNINGNCLDISLSPARRADEPPMVSVQPRNTLVKLINRCKSGGKGEPVLNHTHPSLEYAIGGRCPKPWQFGPVSFPDPGVLFADSLRLALADGGVLVRGTIRRGRVRDAFGALPSNLSIIDVKRTSLEEVLGRVGKDSQNLFAECVLKRAGLAWGFQKGVADAQGSWDLGARAVSHVLDGQVPLNGLHVADGSGLSRENRCTAEQLAATLAWIHRHEGGALFRRSLSAAGVDGSLRRQLKDMPGRLVGKTGTMRGVRSLSGYVAGVDGRQYAIASLFSGYRGTSAPYKNLQDNLCRILADQPAPHLKKR